MMLFEESKSKIASYLSQVPHKSEMNKINICAYVYPIILQSDEPPKVLQYFLVFGERVRSTETNQVCEVISETTLSTLKEEFGSLVDALLEQALGENLPESDFYSRLWTAINNTPFFDRDNAKIFALYYIWIDVRIPYFQLPDGLAMSNQEFQVISDEIRSSIQKARFALKTNKFKSRTSRSSVLLEIISNQKDDKERAVLMSYILAYANQTEPIREAIERIVGKFDQ